MKKLIVLLAFLPIVTCEAQTVTGYWYGQANVEVAGIQNNYLTELIIAQKGNKVKGFFGYYFKDVYQSFVVKGTYDKETRKVVINDIPIIFYQTNSTMNSVDCITSFYGTLRVSKVKTELTGYFYRDKKYTYTCPDLRVNYTLYTEAKVEDSIFKDMVNTRSFWKPQPPPVELVKGNEANQVAEMKAVADAKDPSAKAASDKTATNSNNGSSASGQPVAQTQSGTASNNPDHSTTAGVAAVAAENKPGNSPSDKNDDPQAAAKAGASSVAVARPSDPSSPVIKEEKPVLPPDIVKINTEYKKRKQLVGKLIDVASDSVRLSFYDNAEVDGDSISVFLNGSLVVAHQGLSERAFNVYVKLDSTKDVNEVSMFAENLGKYPPNTALMVISDGEKRYETFLSSDFNGNATIKLRHRRDGVAGN
ncbi:MAG TPA: hypothetical protein VG890_06555 [Puia sp.]|nr:hypothetical protein [Puia sp.]